MIASIPLIVFPFCLIAAAITDMRRFIIPNELSLVLVAGFFIAFAFSGLGWDALVNHTLTGAVTLAFGFGLWMAKVCGAGDSKLLAASALWLGWPVLGTALIYIALAGGGLAMVILIARAVARMVPGVSARWEPMARLAANKKPNAPYGVAIALGALLAFPQSPLFSAFF